MEETTLIRRNRITGLISVLFVAFALPVGTSFYLFFTGSPINPETGGSSAANNAGSSEQFLVGILMELVAIGALILVLHKQGRKVSSIGLSVSWRDIPE